MSERSAALSLLDLGYDPLATEHWHEIDFDDKPDYLQLIDQRLRSGNKPNMEVSIGDRRFMCHSLLLQCHSKLFDELGNAPAVVLPVEKVTPEAFTIIYDWMMAPQAAIQRERFVEVFVAAEFLKIEFLVTQCWICMDSTEELIEERAFLLYQEATRFEQSVLQRMLLRRISKFFLPLVASKNFLDLPLEDATILLKSNSLGVFSEADVFYAACLWLRANWTTRREHVPEIMSLVRFPLIRPVLLAQLNNFDTDERLLDIVRHETTKTLVAQALAYAFDCEKKRSELQELMMVERFLLEDAEAVTPTEGEPGVFAFRTNADYSYEAFLKRLEHLVANPGCWKRWQNQQCDIEELLSNSRLRLSSSVEREESTASSPTAE